MGKTKRRAKHAASDEDREIADLREALKPVFAAGVSVWRMASACGAHHADMQGFLDGQISLTSALRLRLKLQIPELLHEHDPKP